ncbi:hypothetical protein SUNI508_10140 [Seiridium unicorne]|uniref:Uncharacterized protein n=1 Tax=Seiridium unicorne TaxID=138068 RepID=A0ABR2UMH7_9PEZI
MHSSSLIPVQCYSTHESRDTVHHQRQVVLRNSQNAESALFEVLALLWAWRKARFRRITSLMPLLIFSITYITAFTAAGGFSSTISTSIGDEVLLQSDYCGPLITNGTIDTEAVISRLNSESLNNAANYVQQCYGHDPDQSSTTAACDRFVVSSLPTSVANYTAECPFERRICRSPQSTLRLDTGYLDSNDDLGLNAPGDERFAYRYVLHCAPLQIAGYTSHVTDNGTGTGWDRYHYANKTTGPNDNRTQTFDYLYEIEDLATQYVRRDRTNLSGLNFKVGYDLDPIFHGQSSFDWIPELSRSDGDLTIAFLSGSQVSFNEKMDDDWYRATTPWQSYYNTESSGRKQTYHPDVSASPMGCLEQWQWCNSAFPRNQGCGPLGSYLDALYGAAPLFGNLTSEDLDVDRPSSSDPTRNRFLWPTLVAFQYPTRLSHLLGTLGAKSLASQSRLFSGIQLALPNNQWQLDVLQWWSTVLASVQASWSPPLNPEEQKMCDSQKIRSSAHTSFSCFGIYFTFIVGALIVLASYLLEPILSCLHDRRKYKSSRGARRREVVELHLRSPDNSPRCLARKPRHHQFEASYDKPAKSREDDFEKNHLEQRNASKLSTARKLAPGNGAAHTTRPGKCAIANYGIESWAYERCSAGVRVFVVGLRVLVRELLWKQPIRAQYQNLDHFRQNVDNLVACIANNDVADLQPLFFNLTLDTTTAVLFGQWVYSLRGAIDQKDENRVFAEAFTTAQEGLAKRSRLVPLHFLCSPPSLREAWRKVQQFVDRYIEERKTELQSQTDDQSSWFLDQVVAGSNSKAEVRDQLLNVLLTGRDTTAFDYSYVVQRGWNDCAET